MNSKKLAQLTQYIESADVSLQQAREILSELGADKAGFKLARNKAKKLATIDDPEDSGQNKIVEGVFNGQNMIGPDGKEYSVPANYASKSKLVEGDVMKLTIQPDGSFLYKQISPVPRDRIKGKLVMDEITGQFAVLADDNKKYNVLTASVTYFKGEANDQVTILIPKDKTCQWAAIENIVSDSMAPDSQSLPISEKPLPFEKLAEEIESSKPVEVEEKPAEQIDKYEGLTQYAKKDSILPELDELDDTPNPTPESEVEKEKIENMINDDDLDIDDLDKKDMGDL